MIKMKLKLIIIFLVILLCGCVNNDDKLTEEDLKKGTDGVDIGFTSDAPPDSVIEDSSFKIGAMLHNRGFYTAPDVHLVLSTEEGYIQLEDNKKTVEIEGKTLSTPGGGQEKAYFEAVSKQIGAQKDRHPTDIVLTACYNYKTIFDNQLCINPHQYEKGEEDVCTDTSRSFNSQGAPLAVTKVETRMQSKDNEVQPVIIIHVENKGDGTLLKHGIANEACSDKGLKREDFNKVKLDEFHLGNKNFTGENDEIKCTEETNLVDGKGKFRCRVQDTVSKNSPAYNAQARAVLKYGYTKSVSKGIYVEKRI